MDYVGSIYRPPSEANSIIIQVTIGCSHNSCSFCEMYKEKSFSIKSEEQIMEDIQEAGCLFPRSKRLFIGDGDALILSTSKLLRILKKIKQAIPRISRVGIYANCKSLESKSIEELIELHENGLGIIYLGIESGDDETLKNINKNASYNRLIEVGKKVKYAKIKLSVTVLLGIAGKTRSLIHATKTGELLSKIDPDYVGALTLMLTNGTSLYNDYKNGDFELLKPKDMLIELERMILNTTLTDGLFHANHASNYLPISAHLPNDKEKTLQLIKEALNKKIKLKPEYLRGL